MRYALILVALVGLSSRGQASERPDGELAAPAPIVDYYRDHNFVTAFSTRTERQVLAESPAAPRDPRLARVARLMQELQSRAEAVDPGMTKSRGSAEAVVHRSDLLRIKAIRIDEDGARVELESVSIGPAVNRFYVARFGELAQGERMPDVEELRARAGGQALLWTEVHHWRLVDGVWRRTAPTTHFVVR